MGGHPCPRPCFLIRINFKFVGWVRQINTVIIEKGALGGQIATTPIVENYPGFQG
jgi:hypothetical protein